MILFVWDFHGVLEKDNEFAVLEVTNKVLEKFKVNKKISIEETRKLYGLRWRDYFSYCCPNTGDQTIVKMAKSAVDISLNEKTALKYIKPMDDAFFVLKTIKEKGHFNLVISNSSQGALKYFIDSVKIGDLIDEYIGVDNHFKQRNVKNGKASVLKGYIEKNRFNKVVKIGDRETDIEAGICCGAVTYLFSKNKNSSTKADYIISDLKAVLKEV